jgi:hypothetical protein
MTRGFEEEDETAPTNRSYWESKANKHTVALADQLLAIVREFDPALELKSNKFCIGVTKNNRANNFVTFVPKKNTLNVEPRIRQAEEIDSKIASAGLETLGYDKIWGRYRIVLGKDDVTKHEGTLRELMRLAFEQ